MRILIIGSQRWLPDDACLVTDAIADAIDTTTDRAVTVIHGTTARGVDPIVAEWVAEIAPYAARRGVLVEAEQWRSGWVADALDSGVDLCMAFLTSGSRTAAREARLVEKAGVPVLRWRLERSARRTAA